MSWQNIDFLAFEAVEFEMDVDAVIVRLLETTREKIAELWENRQEELGKQIAEAKTEVDEATTWADRDYEEWMHIQRNQALGSLALDLLASRLKTSLRDATRFFSSSHPAKNKYRGDGWLDKVRNEYKDRFNIDFEKLTAFASVRELVLARNAGIHRENGDIVSEYRKKVACPQFLNADAQFSVELDEFKNFSAEIKRFVKSVVEELKKVKKQPGGNG